MSNVPGTIYLLHFDRPYKHARHYSGWAHRGALEQRIQAHLDGRGARLTQVIRQAGIGFRMVRCWTGDRNFERRLKNRGGASRLCPVCQAAAREARKNRGGQQCITP